MLSFNQKLTILYDLLVDNSSAFSNELIEKIEAPEKIEDTHRFSSLLAVLANPAFVDPLLRQLSRGKATDVWLADYLYAAIELLENLSEEDEFDVPDNLINNLETWILDYTGELSWKAANLLKFYNSQKAESIQLRKLNMDDSYMTHAECIMGLMQNNDRKYIALVEDIAEDESRDEDLRDFCVKIINSYEI